MSNYKQKIFSLFSRIHFFNYLTNKEKEFIIKSTFLFVVNDNETIFEKEQIANSFYVVQKGSVKIEIPGRKDLVMKEGENLCTEALMIHSSRFSSLMSSSFL